MKVLITGGSGFLGTNLVSLALSRGHEVLNFDMAVPKIAIHAHHWRRGSIENSSQVASAYEDFGPDIVFHLAARTDLNGHSLADYTANTIGVENVIRAASRLARKPRTIYASSRLVFAINSKPQHVFDYSPSTPYGESKIESERIILANADQAGSWTIVRPTSIWGPWFGVPYRNFFDSVRSRQFVNIAGEDPLKSFGYVGNSVYQLMKLAEVDGEPTDRRVFWLSDYEPIRVSEWAEQIAQAFEVPGPVTVPRWMVGVAAKAGDLVKRATRFDPPITSFRLSNLITPMVYDVSATEAVVGELPFSPRAGIEQTVAWMRDNS